MCSDLKEFDLHARGVANLIESWKVAHSAVRAVWRIEDLISAWLNLSAQADEIFCHFRQHGCFPNSNATFGYFVELLEETIQCGSELENLASMFEAERYDVKGADNLRTGIAFLRRIVDEDKFATMAALNSGALDDWD